MLFGLDKRSQPAERVGVAAAEGFQLPKDNATGTYHGRTNPCSKDNYQTLKVC